MLVQTVVLVNVQEVVLKLVHQVVVQLVHQNVIAVLVVVLDHVIYNVRVLVWVLVLVVVQYLV